MKLGELADGRTVELVEIAAGAMRARIATLGAALHALEVPDRSGTPANVVLGYRDLGAHLDHPLFFGAVVGRFANRIARGSFMLDGVRYQLPINNAPNQLHGGPEGFFARLWTIDAHDAASVTLSLVSEAGDQGYPGRLEARARYAIDASGLSVTLTATTDAPTVVNLSHHPYWNLAGEASGAPVAEHWLQLGASRITPVDDTLIPTGELREVAGGPFDFSLPKPVGRDVDGDDAQLALGRGYDHNFAVDDWDGAPRRVATLFDPGSGRVMEVSATAPGLQFYSGNYLAGAPPGTSGRCYGARVGLCLEPQLFPDAPNQPGFKSARLDPGQRYASRIDYRFRTAEGVEDAFG